MPRSLWRTIDLSVLPDVVPLALAVAVTGASFGAIAVSSAVPVWLVCAMSLLVFAGGSQFMAVGVVATGGSPVAAVLAGLLLNARHLPFGLALGEVLGTGLASRVVGCHLIIDETTAFALAQRDPRRARVGFWTCGITLFTTWNLATLVGAEVGQLIGDPNRFGLDAAFPAALLALLMPTLRTTAPRRAAVVGAAVAVAATPLLPAGIPVLLSVTGVVAAGREAPPRGVGSP
ncbi:MAG: AzlC family ABC transporter permease [Kutzneria sp.]|nr:AzlC family ABC transporter permease [Kutzneria sp.]